MSRYFNFASLPRTSRPLALCSFALLACLFSPPAFASIHASDGDLLIFLLVAAAVIFGPPALLGLFLGPAVAAIALPVWIAILVGGWKYKEYKAGQESAQYQVRMEQQRKQEENSRLAHPLHQAACNGEQEKVLPLLQAASTTVNFDDHISIAKECAIDKHNPDMLATLLKDGFYHTNTYAADALLRLSLIEMDTGLLLAFLDNGIPLDQAQGRHLWWDALLEQRNRPPEQIINWLTFLKTKGVNLTTVVKFESLLSIAFETQSAAVIHFALDTGIDPYARASGYKELPAGRSNGHSASVGEVFSWSPLQSWTLRRFGYTWPLREAGNVKTAALSQAEIATINRRLRELTPEEAELRHEQIQLRTRTPDGGAALFAYMVERGVKLDTSNALGQGLLSASMPYSEPLLAEIDKLSNTQLEQLACPLPAKGLPSASLRDDAEKARAQALLDLLALRKVAACKYV